MTDPACDRWIRLIEDCRSVRPWAPLPRPRAGSIRTRIVRAQSDAGSAQLDPGTRAVKVSGATTTHALDRAPDPAPASDRRGALAVDPGGTRPTQRGLRARLSDLTTDRARGRRNTGDRSESRGANGRRSRPGAGFGPVTVHKVGPVPTADRSWDPTLDKCRKPLIYMTLFIPTSGRTVRCHISGRPHPCAARGYAQIYPQPGDTSGDSPGIAWGSALRQRQIPAGFRLSA